MNDEEKAEDVHAELDPDSDPRSRGPSESRPTITVHTADGSGVKVGVRHKTP